MARAYDAGTPHGDAAWHGGGVTGRTGGGPCSRGAKLLHLRQIQGLRHRRRQPPLRRPPDARIVANGGEGTRGGFRETHISYQPCKRSADIAPHAPLVKSIARRIRSRLPPNVGLDELEQAGLLGLSQAL